MPDLRPHRRLRAHMSKVRSLGFGAPRALGIACLITAVAAAACSSPAPSASPTAAAAGQASSNQGDTFTLANNAAPVSLNPALSGNGRLGFFVQPAYEPLVATQPDGTLKAGLATSWTLAADNKSVQFTIRPDAKFSDGSPVTADAVAASINYFRNANGPFASNLSSVTSVAATAPNTVTIQTSQPNPDLVSLFNSYWLAGLIIGPQGLANPDQLGSTTDGAGPYMLDAAETTSNNTYTYVPNPYYFDPSAIYWKKLVIKVYTDSNSALQALQSGQLNMMYADATLAATASSSGLQVLHSPVQWSGAFLFDRAGQAVPAMGKLEVRQAMNYAIDRATLAKALYGDYAQPTDEVVGPGFPGYDPAYDNKYPFDLDKAKQLLGQAGYGDGFSMTLLTQGTTTNQTLAQALTGQLQKVNITVTVQSDPNTAQWVQDLQSNTFASNAGQLNFTEPSLTVSSVLAPNATWNRFQTTDDQLTQLINQALTADPASSNAAWQKVYDRTVDLAWFLPVVRSDVIFIADKSVVADAPGRSIVINPVTVRPAH